MSRIKILTIVFAVTSVGLAYYLYYSINTTIQETKRVATMEAAIIEARRQTKYLAFNVRPIKPQDAAYPREFENTFLSFLIFAGINLLISLTGSILREQVSN